MLEELVISCFLESYPDAKAKVKIPNMVDVRLRTVEIDCLIGLDALEIKWKDATIDGNYTRKEQKRIQIIKGAGYKPI